jgi:hypothetical protein
MSDTNIGRVISKLEGVRRSDKGRYDARCPDQEGRQARLSIVLTDNGQVLLQRHGGSQFQVSLAGGTVEGGPALDSSGGVGGL